MLPLCDGFRLLLSMAINGPIARNLRSVGTPLYSHLKYLYSYKISRSAISEVNAILQVKNTFTI